MFPLLRASTVRHLRAYSLVAPGILQYACGAARPEGVKPLERTVREDGFTTENAADGTFSAPCYDGNPGKIQE